MNKTKRKIIDAALILLNKEGLGEVSQRSISDYLEISPGNLTYHYKKKSEILEAIYYELVEKMNVVFDSFEKEGLSVHTIIELTEKLFNTLFEYRFFFIDIVQILRNYDSIANHYRQLQIIRKTQFSQMILELAKQGIIRAEELPNEYEELYNRIQLIVDFYLSFVGVNNLKMERKHVQEQKSAFLYTIYPYLTSTGKSLFTTII